MTPWQREGLEATAKGESWRIGHAFNPITTLAQLVLELDARVTGIGQRMHQVEFPATIFASASATAETVLDPFFSPELTNDGTIEVSAIATAEPEIGSRRFGCAGSACKLGSLTGRGCDGNKPCGLERLARGEAVSL